LGIDVLQPRLSWQLQSDQRGAHQTAYRILTALSEKNLDIGRELLWDSGKVETDQSIHVFYNGPTLGSGQRVHWKVLVWNEAGQEIESPSAWWEMGMLEPGDWEGQWVGAAFSGGQERPALFHIYAKNLRLKKNWFAPGCMQLRSGFTNAT